MCYTMGMSNTVPVPVEAKPRPVFNDYAVRGPWYAMAGDGIWISIQLPGMDYAIGVVDWSGHLVYASGRDARTDDRLYWCEGVGATRLPAQEPV